MNLARHRCYCHRTLNNVGEFYKVICNFCKQDSDSKEATDKAKGNNQQEESNNRR